MFLCLMFFTFMFYFYLTSDNFIFMFLCLMFFTFMVYFYLTSDNFIFMFLCLMFFTLMFYFYFTSDNFITCPSVTRVVVFLMLPQFLSKNGRQALIAYAFILALTGPAKNTLRNVEIMSESMACEQVWSSWLAVNMSNSNTAINSSTTNSKQFSWNCWMKGYNNDTSTSRTWYWRFSQQCCWDCSSLFLSMIMKT